MNSDNELVHKDNNHKRKLQRNHFADDSEEEMDHIVSLVYQLFRLKIFYLAGCKQQPEFKQQQVIDWQVDVERTRSLCRM